ncbi:unnamed protein product [Diamesa tonsa]
MGLKSNIKVFLTLRAAEGIFSVVCCLIHVVGFLDLVEPLGHELLFCGSYFGFIFVSCFAIVGLTRGNIMYLVETISSCCGFALFLVTSLLSMANAEQDIHLMYLTDAEEYNHRFFSINRMQSIASLAGALTFLMHGVFAMDLLIIKSASSDMSSAETISYAASLDLKADDVLVLHFWLGDVWRLFKKLIENCFQKKFWITKCCKSNESDSNVIYY